MTKQRELRAIYGVYGLTEWHALMPVGRRKVRVSFTGGQMGGHGVVPAMYATTCPVMQHVVEHSPHFLSGKIRLLQKQPV